MYNIIKLKLKLNDFDLLPNVLNFTENLLRNKNLFMN